MYQSRSPRSVSPASYISSDSSSCASASPSSPVRLIGGLDLYPTLGVATPWPYNSDMESSINSSTASAPPSDSSSPEESPAPTPQATSRPTDVARNVHESSGTHNDNVQMLHRNLANAYSSHCDSMPILSEEALPHTFAHVHAQQQAAQLRSAPLQTRSAQGSSYLPAPLYSSTYALPSAAIDGPMLLLSSTDSVHNSSIQHPSHSSNSSALQHHPHQPLLLHCPSAKVPSSSCHQSSGASIGQSADPSPPPSSTSASSSSSSAPVSSRKRASVSEDTLRERARKRLENHKRYDRKRAVVLHEIHKDLRQVIHSSQQIIQGRRLESAEEKSSDSDDAAMRLPSRMELEALSHSELFATAGNAIRSLQQVKRQLESQLQELPDDSEVQSDCPPAADSANLATPVQTQQINVLLSAVQSASRLYADQLQKVHSLLVTDGPHAISDISLLPVHSVGGLTGRHFNSILRKKVLLDHLPARELTHLDMWGASEDTDMYCDVNCPQLLQIYAMCALLSKSFAQQLSEYQQRFFPNAAQVLEFLQQSVRSQLSSSYDSAALLSASPIATGRGDEHPLNQYSIPPGCFQVVGDVLNSLASLSESEYNKQVDFILPQLRSPFPIDRVRAPHFPRISVLDRRDRSTMEFMFSKYFTPTWAQMQALADLWTGRKAFVHFPGLTQMSPSDKILQGDFDFAFLLNPTTGEKVGLISFLKRLYFSQSVQTVDKTVAPPIHSAAAAPRTVEFAAAASSMSSSSSLPLRSSNAFAHGSPAGSSSVSSTASFYGAAPPQAPFHAAARFSRLPSSS